MTITPNQNTSIRINPDWCKRCGICLELCPKQVLGFNATGRVVALHPQQCIACKTCERICPDFAINVEVTEE